jgi:hypothetical protein
MSISYGGNNITFPDASTQNTSPKTGFVNRIINGGMTIDQRNAGAAVTANGTYPVDRFLIGNGTDGAFSAQRDTVAPSGFINSLKVTTTTADATLTTTQGLLAAHYIEGLNVADLAWGTASAQPVTLSFWVRSSLTGTFGGSLQNSALDRSYPFTYTISSANTYEYKTITVPGDTSGTWLTTNGIGLRLWFGLGVGPDRSGTAGAWSGSDLRSVTGAVSVIGTLSATWFITGVQLEKGSVVTPFEFRSIGTELALCQRYYQKSYPQATVPGAVTLTDASVQFSFGTAGTGIIGTFVTFFVVMRAAPTVILFDLAGNSAKVSALGTGAAATDNITPNTFGATDARLIARIFNVSAAGMAFMYTVSAEL